MSDIELISFILKGFAAFGLSMMLFALLPKTPARRFLALLISSFIAFTFAKTPQQQSLGNREAAANVAQREQLSALMSEGDDDGDEDIYDYIIIEDEEDEEEEDELIERVDIAAIVCANGVVSVEFKWPQEMEIHKWDVFLMGYEELGGDVALSKKYNPTSGTNLAVSVTAVDFPENVLPHKYFFKAEAVKDFDHDGLSDEQEILWGTNPNDSDSDADGLSDFFEIENSYDPTNDDMDGDGVKDGVEYNLGTSSWIPEDEMETEEGTFYEILGSVHDEYIPYDPSTNQTSRALSDLLPPNQPGVFSDIGYEIYDITTNAYHLIRTGLTFRPTRSGFFSFQIAADDRASVTIGSLSLTDNWQTRGNERVAYFEAGHEYDIEARIWNDGGRTYFNFVKFGEFKRYRVTMKNELTKDTIIYEDAYENKPGQIVPKHSTDVTSTVFVNGGRLGARLEIDVEGLDKVELVSGCALPEHLDTTVLPEAPFLKVGKYIGKSKSGEENDVKIKVKITDLETGAVFQEEKSLTIYKISVQASTERDSQYRHVFGPLEEVTLWHEPFIAEATWALPYEHVVDMEYNDGSYYHELRQANFTGDIGFTVRTLIEPTTYNAVVNINGVPFHVPLEVIAPKGRIGRNPWIPTIDQWLEAIGEQDPQLADHWCAYSMDVYVLPNYVSFAGIRIKEGECPSTNSSGSLSFGASNPHNAEAGAGRIIKVKEQDTVGSEYEYKNKAGFDIVSVEGVVQTNGSWVGRNDWHIPVYWQPIVDATNNWDRIRDPFTYNNEYFRCNGRGTLSIQKMKCFGTRTLQGNQDFREL